MAELRPLRGLRFQKGVVPDMADVLCPPYDIISTDEQRQLYQRSPFNVVRLEYGETSAADTDADNRYTRAAATLDEWRRSGVLAPEEAPALYVYDQGFSHLGKRFTRRGLFARVRLHDWDEGIIRPHEFTMSGPKEDRLKLLRALRLNVSPILALYRDPAGEVRKMLDEARSPLLEATDAGGQTHCLHRITDRRAIERIGALFQDKTIYVIDGHHRYETALAYRQERQAQSQSWTGEEGENFVLLTLVAGEDPGLLVLPTHRLIKSASLPADLIPRLERLFHVEDVRSEVSGENAWQRMEALLAEAGRDRIAIGVAGQQDKLRLILTVRDPQEIVRLMPSDKPASWCSLGTAVLQALVLEGILGVKGDSLEFTHDGEAALRLVESGQLAFFLNATPPERLIEVADAGERMPQKSTYFQPKLPAGLVMNPLD